MRVTTTEKFSVYWNYQVWHLAKGEAVSGGLAEYLVATGSPVEEAASGPAVDPVEETASRPPADGDGVPDGTITQVQQWVGEDSERAALALAAEQAKGDAARSTLVASLQKVLAGN